MADLLAWKRVVLGDLVEVVTEYWDRNPDVPERFVAGEHIDEGDLRVRRWGMTSDELVPPTFNRRFRAGDVLFHSRNLKKLACPDFGGITGEKLFVLRSKDPTRLLPTLLPFLLQTDAFNEYVSRMWAGSTNKFLNKAPLVKYEFALPPLEEQRRLVRLLSALESVGARMTETIRASRAVREALVMDQFAARSEGQLLALDEVCDEITVGIVVKPADLYVERGAGVPALIMKNVQRGRIDARELLNISHAGHKAHSKSAVRAGDVVAVRSSGSIERTGDAAVVPPSLEGANCIDLLIARPGRLIRSEYLVEFLNAPYTRGVLVGRSSGTMQKHLNVSALKKLLMPVVPEGEQTAFLLRTAEMDSASASLKLRHAVLRKQRSAALSFLEGSGS